MYLQISIETITSIKPSLQIKVQHPLGESLGVCNYTTTHQINDGQ